METTSTSPITLILDGLLAKSDRQPLAEHTQHVVRYAQQLAPHDSVITAAQWHDVGKAAHWFQRAMKGEEVQGWYRHEILSALAYLYYCHTQQIDVDDDVLLAILTHHKDLDELAIYINADEALEFCSQLPERIVPSDKVTALLNELRVRYMKLMYATPRGINARAVRLRGTLIAADHAASAGLERPLRVDKPFHLPNPRSFQQSAARPENMLLIAQTGSGKTEAALMWYETSRNTHNRLIYLLPYRASAEAMRERLVRIWGNDLVGIIHARDIHYAYQRYLSEYDEHSAQSLAKQDANLNRLVHKPIIVTTPYQLLNYLLGIKRFEVGTVLMRNASVVFDEIHSYDTRIVALLLVLLEVLVQLNSRVMVMSATMPSWLRRELVQRAPFLEIESQPVFPARHRLRLLDMSLEQAIPLVQRDLEQGKRVLVVCNRVAQAQQIYQQFSDFPSRRLLHSRFTYRDRGAIEREILNRSTQPQLLVATQVVEVSLDISYDTCYTEVAPVEDLLQRFGRVNRRGELGVVDVHVCTQYDHNRLRAVYDLGLVQRSLQELLPHNTRELDWWLERQLVEQAHEGNGLSDVHLNLYKLFQQHIDGLQAGHSVQVDIESSVSEDVQVVPAELYDEYLQRVEEGLYLAAKELLVPVLRGIAERHCTRIGSDIVATGCIYSELGLHVPRRLC